MFDIGDPVPLSVEVRDLTGTLANATLVVVTVTLPDGTTATPAVTNAGTGIYTASYPAAQAGRHTVRWVATGLNASAFTDSFDVEPGPLGLVSLAEVKTHLNITGTDDDEELRRFIGAATDYIEGKVGPVIRRTIVTPPITPGVCGELFLDGPVISLTSITSALGYTTIYNVASYTLVGDQVVPNVGAVTFASPVVVTYVGGRTIVPELIRQGALDYVGWLWESQRGAALPLAGGDFEVTTTATVPYRITQYLEPYTRGAVA